MINKNKTKPSRLMKLLSPKNQIDVFTEDFFSRENKREESTVDLSVKRLHVLKQLLH